MRFLSGLTLFFYTFVLLLVGGFFVAFSTNVITQEAVIAMMGVIFDTANARLCLGATGALLIFISILVMQIALGKLTREKTIAFENPDGQVTISLSAIEDFIKRTLKQLPEVKELRPAVKATKKGITIINRVTLFSDISIPETTEKIQNLVKARVQDMLGVDEPINIKIHVVKISHKEESAKSTKKEDKLQQSQFRGNIEY